MEFNSVRIFVSSTFTDFAAEREQLSRVVIPQVNRRCRNLGIEFVSWDFRWGLTDDQLAEAGALFVQC